MGTEALKTRPKQAPAKKLPAQIAAADAKANLLRMLSSVKETGEYVITKRGKPVAKLIPFEVEQRSKKDIYGCMKGTFEIVGDIIGPEPDAWDALR